MKVYLEIGEKKVFAGALEWPGWCRSGRDEETALQALFDYRTRYAQALDHQGISFDVPERRTDLKVVERLPGSATTDFGAPDAVPAFDQQPVDTEELEHQQNILKACWAAFDAAIRSAAGKELRTGPRGGGRDLNRMIEHVLGAEAGYLSRINRRFKPDPSVEAAAELARIRQSILDAMTAAVQDGLPEQGPRGGKLWKLRYYVRRAAWHVLDHAWELEDRILADE